MNALQERIETGRHTLADVGHVQWMARHILQIIYLGDMVAGRPLRIYRCPHPSCTALDSRLFQLYRHWEASHTDTFHGAPVCPKQGCGYRTRISRPAGAKQALHRHLFRSVHHDSCIRIAFEQSTTPEDLLECLRVYRWTIDTGPTFARSLALKQGIMEKEEHLQLLVPDNTRQLYVITTKEHTEKAFGFLNPGPKSQLRELTVLAIANARVCGHASRQREQLGKVARPAIKKKSPGFQAKTLQSKSFGCKGFTVNIGAKPPQ